MSRVRLLQSIAVLVAAGSLSGCDRDGEREPGRDARLALVRAAHSALGPGPLRAVATVRSGAVRYRVRGRLDASDGYRFCGVIVTAPSESFRGHWLWLGGRAASDGTLTAPGRRCARTAVWLDDHPPTLQLYRGSRADAGIGPGAEEFLHAALTALTGLTRATVLSARAERCGSSDCVRAVVDFRAFDRTPARHAADTPTPRLLLRSLGRHPVTARIHSDGRLSRIGFAGSRVTVSLELSHYGEERHVPRVLVRAIE